jgi:ADP-ribose pyrophosphatase YjhB (NUDIX family)
MAPEPVHILAQRIQALAQTGLAFTKDRYDIERYEQLRDIAVALMGDAGLLTSFESEWGYATPKVDTRAIILRENKVLLVREAADGLWCPPGGWADVGDQPSVAVEREALEETGLIVRATRLLGLWDRNLHGHPPRPFHAYKLFFLCEELSGELRLCEDTLEIGFFEVTDLPPLSLDRVVAAEIEKSVELALGRGPTYFD